MPRGVNLRTPENIARAAALRERGMLLREIAAELGIATSTADSWLNDPDGAKKKARIDRYRKPCATCGTLCDGSRGYVDDDVFCKDCAPGEYAIWTPDAIVYAIQEWADEHGGVPPKSSEWNHFTPDRTWPYVSQVLAVFGTWNTAIEVAGFEPRPTGMYGRPGEDPAEVQRTVDLYRSGLTCAQVAAVLGDIGAEGVRDRLVAAGEPRRSPGRRAGLAA